LGPRQVGKTTLAKAYIEQYHLDRAVFFDLDNPIDLARLENPFTLSKISKNLIVIDEIQRIPEIFPLLRVLIDEHEKERHFLILGSAFRQLIRQSSESLAGRISYLELTPFTLEEVDHHDRLWARGGFPKAYPAANDEDRYSDRPQVTASMKIAFQDLKLDHLYLVFPGKISFPLADGMTAQGLENFFDKKEAL
jgi:predicted AAA+ superfamily ATPase